MELFHKTRKTEEKYIAQLWFCGPMHDEIVMKIRGSDVTIVTSAKTQDETFILWSGFLQKEV